MDVLFDSLFLMIGRLRSSLALRGKTKKEKLQNKVVGVITVRLSHWDSTGIVYSPFRCFYHCRVVERATFVPHDSTNTPLISEKKKCFLLSK